MAIKRDGDKWKVDCQPGGRGAKRIRKWFDTKAEAVRFERHVHGKHQEGKPWEAPRRDTRRLSQLVKTWYERHGRSLKDGKARQVKLLAIAERMDDPIAANWTAQDFTEYRSTRLDQVADATANRELAYLRAMFNELRRCGEWEKDNPLALVKQIKVDETELTYLDQEQIRALLDALGDSDAGKVARVCLSTGARWSEAETLRAEQVRPYRVTYSGTKSGKVRAIPISKELHDLITGRSGRLFGNCYHQFRAGVMKAKIQLPPGQLTHVLRHTFASHFMQAGGNILTLQRILGHQSITMTMRYAHLAPDHLQEALKLNPISAYGME